MTMLVEQLINLTRRWNVRGKGRVYQHLTPWTGTRRVFVTSKYQMELDLRNGQERQIFMGCFNLRVQRILRGILRPGASFLDIGANCGFFTVLAADLVGAKGRVVAVEPFPATHARLSANLALNSIDVVTAFDFALGASDGTLRLFAPPGHEYREFNVSIVPSQEAETLDVPVRRLDSMAEELGPRPFELVKIDVEGSELDVLQGGQQFFAGGRARHLVCEINTHYLAQLGRTSAELIDRILSLGFVRVERWRGRLLPVQNQRESPAQGDPDFLFAHKSALPERV